ncbi:MAG: ABC transporter ATP-binding protein [Alphaproteobacteria bacterium]
MTAALQIRDLTKRYRDAVVLNRLNLDVEAGEVLCVVGPSGCGKSTLLRLVAGLEAPDDGTIHAGGRLLAGPRAFLAPEKRGLNMVFQDYALWPHMKVRAIVGYGLAHLPAEERRRRVDGLLSLMQIGALADRFPSQISGGQQQRVAIARALATDPTILLFDEPLSNLDVQLRLEMRQEFVELFGRLGKTAIYVTHDPQEACAFADRLLVMRAGEIEQIGPPQSLFADPRSPWVAALAGYDSRLPAKLGDKIEGERHEVWVGGERMVASLRGERAGSVADKSDITLMLHPSAIELIDDATPGDGFNSMSGTVKRSIYEGRQWRVLLTLADGTALSLVSRRPASPGDAVRVVFPISETLAFSVMPTAAASTTASGTSS